MSEPIQMIGRVYGRLTVIGELEPVINIAGRSFPLFLCRCECGREKKVRDQQLRRGATRSCGCLRNATLVSWKHEMDGWSDPLLYQEWSSD